MSKDRVFLRVIMDLVTFIVEIMAYTKEVSRWISPFRYLYNTQVKRMVSLWLVYAIMALASIKLTSLLNQFYHSNHLVQLIL
jgi:hypothetical protein